MKIFIDRLLDKIELSKEDSDFTYFFNLLVGCEAVAKTIILITTANIKHNDDRHQYKMLYDIVRADGIGTWSKSLDEMLIGTASQYLDMNFRTFQAELTKKTEKEEWQYKCVTEMMNALSCFSNNIEKNSSKVDLKTWFKIFSELRNKTRGHGSIPQLKASKAAVFLNQSLTILIQNLSLFNQPYVHLKRNLSGKYKVTPISNTCHEFNKLKSSDKYQLKDGVYLYLNGFKRLDLFATDTDLSDFYIANGSFSQKKYELLSYLTDNKMNGDSKEYLNPTGQLPPSESEGFGELNIVENCFTNVPILNFEFIKRSELENQLYDLLIDERRAVVTLLGRGGIGKTSLALKVIPKLFVTKRYDAVIWFSSRDVDLSIQGPKIVKTDVISKNDISKCFSKLVLTHNEFNQKGFDAVNYFQEELVKSKLGSCLFVFDNFETTNNPLEVFKWIDTFIRNPNKILITTRLRDFVGDYPIQVLGMNEDESRELINYTANNMGISKNITENIISEIITVSAGHPYIIKVIMGDLAKDPKTKSIPKIIAGSDEILTALFERTYAAINPCAQRVFMTLSGWNSAVPRLCFESILMNSIDEPLEVEKAIDLLIQYSMVEELKSNVDENYFIGLPYVAKAFGEKKLKVSPIKIKIANDLKQINALSPTQLTDKNLELNKHFKSYLKNCVKDINEYIKQKNVLLRICSQNNSSRLILSNWLYEFNSQDALGESKKVLQLYLENGKMEGGLMDGWGLMARISSKLSLPFEEAHALIELSQFKSLEFNDLSKLVNTINHMLSTRKIDLEEKNIKNNMLSKLFEVIWKRKSEGTASDFSRIAWLALHLNEDEKARLLTNKGLEIDPDNTYCIKLDYKLKRSYH